MKSKVAGGGTAHPGGLEEDAFVGIQLQLQWFLSALNAHFLEILGIKVEFQVEDVLLPRGALGICADKEDLVGSRSNEPRGGLQGDVRAAIGGQAEGQYHGAFVDQKQTSVGGFSRRYCWECLGCIQRILGDMVL